MSRYSVLGVARHGLRGDTGWPRARRSPRSGPAFDVVTAGGGGHGLATACYLAREHGASDVLVVDRG